MDFLRRISTCLYIKSLFSWDSMFKLWDPNIVSEDSVPVKHDQDNPKTK